MAEDFTLPPSFARTTLALRGPEGTAWLDSLPGTLARWAERYSLQIGPHFPNLSFNYAAPARLPDGTGVVLKVCFPDRWFRTEVEALRLYNGDGLVRLLEVGDEGVMLLERLEPGVMLNTLQDDEEATSIAAVVMRQLHKAPPEGHQFPSVADWAEGLTRLRAIFGGQTGPFPESLVSRAERLFAELLATSGAPVVLHGDLHHYNILSAQREPWLAIDPKGVIGDAAYEIGAYLRNPWPDMHMRPDIERLLIRRVYQFASELCLERERIWEWGIAQSVLSAWWTYEDGGDQAEVAASIELAEVFVRASAAK